MHMSNHLMDGKDSEMW